MLLSMTLAALVLIRQREQKCPRSFFFALLNSGRVPQGAFGALPQEALVSVAQSCTRWSHLCCGPTSCSHVISCSTFCVSRLTSCLIWWLQRGSTNSAAVELRAAEARQ